MSFAGDAEEDQNNIYYSPIVGKAKPYSATDHGFLIENR